MATLAMQLRVARGQERAAEATIEADPFLLRALPNDDVYFFAKRIDNSRLVREADPKSRRACWSTIMAACGLALLLTMVLVPAVANILAGYQLQSLRQERQRLLDERSALEVRQAALLSPARLRKLAEEQKLTTPGPGQVLHLDPRPDGSMALNITK